MTAGRACNRLPPACAAAAAASSSFPFSLSGASLSICSSSGVKEMIDCVDDPLFSEQREMILSMKEMCADDKSSGVDCPVELQKMQAAFTPARCESQYSSCTQAL